MKRFALLCTPRSGSTFFFSTLINAGYLPDRATLGATYEILNPVQVPLWQRFIEEARGQAAAELQAYLSAAYDRDVALARGMKGFTGYKLITTDLGQAAQTLASSPLNLAQLDQLLTRLGVFKIVLWRADVASQVASFLASIESRRWPGSSADKGVVLKTDEEQLERARRIAVRFARETAALLPLADAVLRYEDLCSPGYTSGSLDSFFARPIGFASALVPTTAESYVEDWPAFKSAIEGAVNAAVTP